MKIDFKQKKYILPIIIFPFTLLGFYLYKDTFKSDTSAVLVQKEGLQSGLSDVSESVKKNELQDKLENYENTYKNARGENGMSNIDQEKVELQAYDRYVTPREELKNEEIENTELKGYNPPKSKKSESSELLNLFRNEPKNSRKLEEEEDEKPKYDPMDIMKKQANMMDSINKANDPEFQAEMKKLQKQELLEKELAKRKANALKVQKANATRFEFNTIKPVKENEFIKAIIDENVKGYAGSRIRIRLLEDVKIGTNLLSKGTYLYAIINGFTEQRVMMKIVSVMYQNKILPINLDIFDMDGMLGLYVPSSAFRDFTKELGSSTMQGQDLASGNSQDFLMSTMSKAFQSTSQALASAIRKNKAKFKYNTYIFLIDEQELQNKNN
jgi:conjugative transposon TraM protein